MFSIFGVILNLEAKPHILFISSWYPNRNHPGHGLFNKHFAEAAVLHHSVSVIHISSEPDLKTEFELLSEEKNGILTLQVYYRKVTSSVPFWSQSLKQKKIVTGIDLAYHKLVEQKGKPDLIHLNVVLPAGLAVLHLHKKYNIPFVVNEGWTGYMKEDGRYKGIIMKLLTRRILSKARKIMPVSEDLKEAMQAHGLKGNYQIVPNVIQTELFLPQVKTAHTPFRLVHVSTLDPTQKNVEGIIRAFQMALIQNEKLELLIIGDSENKAKLIQHVKQNHLQQKVHFTGLLNEIQLAEKLRQSDALIMFSNFESFGVVIGEALSCGIPVISSKSGGLSNLLNADLGLQVEKRNELQLSQAILFMAENYASYKTEALRTFIEQRYSKASIGTQLRNVYMTALNRN